jgi:predicted TPR repeat methyltransferase
MVTSSAPLFVSSGDLIPDRRYRWAIDHARRGDLAVAADILVQTVELAPAFAAAWFALGAIRDVLGDRAGAIAAFAVARDADPQDYHGARLHLARLGPGEAAPAMTETYVRRLFDQHAPDFDATMLERLDYRGPQLLLGAVQAATRERMRFRTALGLGCGTWLGSAAFRPYVDWLTGVDLPPAMIHEARQKGLYDRLIASDLTRSLRAEAADQAQYHLVPAADVLVYCGELHSIAAATAAVLAPDGLFAFTVESHDGLDVVLRETLRYAHSADYARDALKRAGLNLLALDPASKRTEKGVPISGLVIVARSGG